MTRNLLATLVTPVAATVLATMLLAAICAASAPDDIVGYSSGKDIWTLRMDKADVNLDGFAYSDESDDDMVIYGDERRTVKFEGKSYTAEVTLYFVDGELDSFCIFVPVDEKSFKSIKRYYQQRLSECEFFSGEGEYCQWFDDEEDYVSLAVVDDESSGTGTSIFYGQDWVYPENL